MLKKAFYGLLGLVLSVLVLGGGYVAYYQIARAGAERHYLATKSEWPPRLTKLGDGRVQLRNPIVETGQDPWIVPLDSSHYLYVYSDHDVIIGKIGPNIWDWDARPETFRWSDPAGELVDYWAPEAHRVRGQWVIYFAANRGEALHRGMHRTYALTAIDNDPAQGFELHGPVPYQEDAFAIDATVLEHAGRLYTIWSGSETNSLNQRLYITEMADPFTPVGDRILIAEPTHEWELRGRRFNLWPSINEGPTALKHDGRTFVIYSASGSWSDHYQLGQLELTGDNPLNPAHWTKKPTPVLASANGVLAPGHAGFVRYRGRDYIVYHAAKFSRAGWDREVHLQPFEWRAGEPHFGDPVGREAAFVID